jgi:hypothetical protein
MQFAKLVGENVASFDQAFWIRIATRVDVASEEEKERLRSLADATMRIVDAMMKQTESQLQNSGVTVQDVLKAGANDKGEWTVPLAEDRIQAMREVCLLTTPAP